MFNILDYGAVADGVTINTEAIQKTIDACASAGGGRVLVPAGVFKSGTIWLRSHVELHLSQGATLLASDNHDDYNAEDAYEQNYGVPGENWVGEHFIIAHEIEDASITGFGTIDGNCYAFVDDYFPEPYLWGWRSGIIKCKDPVKLRPGQLIVFIECKHIAVQDITVRNSPCWSLFLHGCDYVSVRGYKAFNPINMLNSDGIDIDTCRYVTVSDCIIETGDDAITVRCSKKRLKNQDRAAEYITITNCVLHTGICAFRLGVGYGEIRHVQIFGITISRCHDIVQFCSAYLDHGCACFEDIHITDISAADTDIAIHAFANNGAYIKDVTIENIRSTATMMSIIHANNGTIDNFKVRNMELKVFERKELQPHDLPKYIFSVKNASNVLLSGVEITGHSKTVIENTEFENCENLEIQNCKF